MTRVVMPSAVRAAYRDEIDSGRVAAHAGDVTAAWSHFERAHVLAQPSPAGNDGRARTPLLATAPVPADLAAVLEGAS